MNNFSTKQTIGIKSFYQQMTNQILVLLTVFFFVALNSPLMADNLSDTDKYAWSESSGWLNFKSTHEQVSVFNDHLEGYVWAENVGWIRVGTHTGGGIFTYANNSANSYGVNNDGSGHLSGYGWGENIGWVNFNPSHSQVTIDAVTGDFNGYAWSENIGWIHFQNTSPAYKVKRIIPADTTPDAFSFTDQINVTLSTLTISNAITMNGINTSAAISVTGGAYEINDSGTWLTATGSVVTNDTVKVRHTSSASYSATVNTILTIGGVSDTFSSTTSVAPAGNILPDAPDGGNTGGTVTFAVPVETLSNLSVSTADGNKPAGITTPYGKISYQVTSATPGGLVTVRLVFSTTLPVTLSLYKVDIAGTYSLMPENSGVDGYWVRVDNNTLDITLRDNGQFDLNNTLGIIDVPIVIAVRASSQPIPTLSFWGLLLLGLFLSLFGVRFLPAKSIDYS